MRRGLCLAAAPPCCHTPPVCTPPIHMLYHPIKATPPLPCRRTLPRCTPVVSGHPSQATRLSPSVSVHPSLASFSARRFPAPPGRTTPPARPHPAPAPGSASYKPTPDSTACPLFIPCAPPHARLPVFRPAARSHPVPPRPCATKPALPSRHPGYRPGASDVAATAPSGRPHTRLPRSSTQSLHPATASR
jgi:hypothetical protein